MTGYVVLASAIPDYILALIALYLFAFKLNVFPRMGAYDIQYTVGFNPGFIGNCLYHAALPILSYTFIQTANWALLMKGSSVAVLGDDYIAAAKARGIPNSLLINRYLKKNAMLPLFASLTLAFATIFGGSPLVESIFNYPGIGQAFSTYISQRDYFLIVGILLFTSFIVVIANLIADSLYSFIDPRIRRGS
jgi:peptide/nickel transport system permease protein